MSTALVFFAARLLASTTRRARPPARGSAEEDAEVYHTNETKKEIRQSHSSHRARRRSDPSRRHHTPRRPARTRHSRTQKNPTRPNPQTHRPSPPAPSPRRTHDAPCASKRIDKIPLKQILPSRVPVDVARARSHARTMARPCETLSRRGRMDEWTRPPTGDDAPSANANVEPRASDVSLFSSYLGETHGAKAGVGRDVDAEHIDVMWRRRVGGRVT